jgi:pilus assembly protein FimV
MVKRFKLKAAVAAVAFALSGAMVPTMSHAAGMGKINVMSSLGQPFKAEIELTSVSREEAVSLAAKLASPDAHRQANVDFNPALLGLKFEVKRRPSGQYVVEVSSAQPINDPFLDMLVELNWSSGRLVREYTMLLDPNEVTPKPLVKAETAPVSPPVAATTTATQPPVAPAAQAQGATRPKPVEPAPKKGTAQPKSKATETQATGSAAGSYTVKSGDTLGKIARQAAQDGVSLDQMLVALYRANKDAFVGDNMNRLKAGAVLTIPDKETAAAIAAQDARRLIVAQTADFNDYRAKLAGVATTAPATKAAEAPKQAASGKVTTKVEDKAKPTAADQLKLSKADTGKAAGKGVKAAEEDAIAKDRAAKDAKARATTLEKNVADLQKLLEIWRSSKSKPLTRKPPPKTKLQTRPRLMLIKPLLQTMPKRPQTRQKSMPTKRKLT